MGDISFVWTSVAKVARGAIDPTTWLNAAAIGIRGIRMCAHLCSVGPLVYSTEMHDLNYTLRIDVGKELEKFESGMYVL